MGKIKKIRIQNFKSLKDVTIDFKPLTFLFGPNSSGKSSVLKALMFLSKNISLEKHSNINYEINKNVNLNSYEQIVINNDLNKDIKFQIYLEGDIEFFSEELICEILPKKKNPIEYLENYINKSLGIQEKDNYYIKIEKGDLIPLFLHANSFPADFLFGITEKPFARSYKYNVIVNLTFSYIDGTGYLKKIELIEKTNKIQIFIKNERIKKTNDYSKKWNLPRGKYSRNETQFVYLDDPYKSKCIFKNKDIEIKVINYQQPFEMQKSLFSIDTLSDLLGENEENDKREKVFHTYYIKCFLLYLFYDIIPNNIYIELVKYFHAPTVREIPKTKYILENEGFSKNEYYGFLCYLDEEFNQLYSYIKKNNLIDIKENQDIDVYSLIDNDIECSIIDIFKSLKLLGYEKHIVLRKSENKEFGYFYLKDNRSLKTLFYNESSGLIQLLPIIISLQINDDELMPNKKFNRFTDGSLNEFDFFYTFLFEQPELHLHPKVQSKLAEVFVDSINKNEYISIINETHSEHLIKKIQLLVAKRKVKKEKISVNYLYMEEGITRVKKMELDDTGFFKEPWPNGFFDESYTLSLELLLPNKN